MTNHFIRLDLPASLALDQAGIESAWETATRQSHDTAERDFEEEIDASLNEARATLADPVLRLEHWLSIRSPDLPVDRSIAPALMDLFADLTPALDQADSVVNALKKTTTTLAKALLTENAVQAQLQLQEQMQRIQLSKGELIGHFEDLESAAESGDYSEAVRVLVQLKFLKKWEQQCQQRLLALLEC
ncbi:MAG: hypothetical protein AAGA96_11725 [Verrucomicrobiota bacterium]